MGDLPKITQLVQERQSRLDSELISALTVVWLQSNAAPPLTLPPHRSWLLKQQGYSHSEGHSLQSAVKRHPQVNDVARRLRAGPTINLVVTNNIGRVCWPPA